MVRPENAQVAEPVETVTPIADSESHSTETSTSAKVRPFVLDAKRGSGGGKMPLMLMVVGALVIFGIGMLAFLSTKGSTKKKTQAEAAKPSLGRVAGPVAPGDLVPSDRLKPSSEESTKGGGVDAKDIEKTKAPKVTQAQPTAVQQSHTPGKRLDQVGKFEEPDTSGTAQSKWIPPPYGTSQAEQETTKKEQDALGQPALVFVAHTQSNGGAQNKSRSDETRTNNLGLAPGFHVAAQLESMATTAVRASVVAVVEYNYERDGAVLIPAGSRIVGKIAQADPSGYMNITFSTIQFPHGEPEPIDAVATDMNLQAIKGKVTGKQAGKSMLVKSLAGIGETTAMIVGAPSGSSAFSENDLLRMRIADNIGNASDQQIMQMMTMQHIVVSVNAGTEIYVVFEKSQQTDSVASPKTVEVPQADTITPDTQTNQ